MLKVWSTDGSSVFPLEQFGDYTFVLSFFRLFHYHYIGPTCPRTRGSIAWVWRWKQSSTLNPTPLLFQLQKDLDIQMIQLIASPSLLCGCGCGWGREWRWSDTSTHTHTHTHPNPHPHRLSDTGQSEEVPQSVGNDSNRTKSVSARHFSDQLCHDAEHQRKIKKRNQLPGLHKSVDVDIRRSNVLLFAGIWRCCWTKRNFRVWSVRSTTSAQTDDWDLRVNSKKIFPQRSQLRWGCVVARFVEWHSTVCIDIWRHR